MSNTFPKFYPYLNPNGVLIEKRDVEEVAKKVFENFGQRSREYGLALAEIMLWALPLLRTKETFYRLVAKEFKRKVKQVYYDELLKEHRRLHISRRESSLKIVGSEMVSQEENDFDSPEDRILKRADFRYIVSAIMPMKELVKLNGSQKARALEKIKEVRRRIEGE